LRPSAPRCPSSPHRTRAGDGSSDGGQRPRDGHAAGDQWLSVVSGSGTGTVEGRSYDLAAGTLLLIEPGETHGIENTGSEPLATIAVSAPREY
jgi:mannose-6-phosphate isomerase-like protein (cupin superfamily)